MKVSIITVVRNAEGCIPTTLESVAAQDYPDIEHVVVDGASTDGTAEAVARTGHRVAQFVSEPDRGVYDAFNKGLALAKGDIIGFLNAGDTYISTNVVRRIAKHFDDAAIEAIFGDVAIVEATGSKKILRRFRSSSFRPQRFGWGFMPAHPTLFVRRETYARCGGYDPSYRIAGDFELCIRLFAERRIGYLYLSEILVQMPTGGLSTSGWGSKWTITREMHRACRTHGIRTSYVQLLARFPVKLLELLRHGD